MASSTRRLLKKEVKYVNKRLKDIDKDIMEAFVVKEVERSELHIKVYASRLALWEFLKSRKQLTNLVEFLLKMLCDLFCAHSTGKARFATLLADWYQAV